MYMKICSVNNQSVHTDIVNPEQSVPFVKLDPPYTYGFPRNFLAYATTADAPPLLELSPYD